jgi:hypothetical protein
MLNDPHVRKTSQVDFQLAYQPPFARPRLPTNGWPLLSYVKVDDVWRSRMLPRFEAVADVASGDISFVLNTYDSGCQCWPLVPVAGTDGMYRFNTAVTSPRWIFCMGFDGYRIVPTQIASPLRCRLTGMPDFTGIVLRKTGPPQTVLAWQTEHGFPDVPQACLQKVYNAEGLDEFDETQAVYDVKEELRIDLMAKLRPDWSQEDAAKAVQEGRRRENLDEQKEVAIDEDMIRDVMPAKDHADMFKFATDVKAAKLKKKVNKSMRKELVGKYFKPAVAKKAAAKAVPRWKPPVHKGLESATAFLVKNKPPGCSFVTDAVNGRFQIAYGLFPRKGFSWHARGMTSAVDFSLHYMWSCHRDATLQDPPWDLEKLSKALADKPAEASAAASASSSAAAAA